MAEIHGSWYDPNRKYQIPTPSLPSPRFSVHIPTETQSGSMSKPDVKLTAAQQLDRWEPALQDSVYELPDDDWINYRPTNHICAGYIHSDYRPQIRSTMYSEDRDSRYSEHQNPDYLTTASQIRQYLRDCQLPDSTHNVNARPLLPEPPAPTARPIEEQYRFSPVSWPSSQQSGEHESARSKYCYLPDHDDAESTTGDDLPFKSDKGLIETRNQKKGFHWQMSFLMVCLCQFQIAIDITIVVTALPALATDLGGSFQQGYWLGTGFVLGSTVAMPLFGMFSEIFGRKILIQVAVLIFLFGSILCATAQNIYWLIATRVIQGVGGGGMLNLASVITSDMTSVRERGKYLGLSSIAYALGMALGNPVGAAVSEYNTWRWIFYINIPIGITIFAGIWIFLHLELETASFRERILKIDWLGAIVFVGASVSLLVGLTFGGVMYPWNHPRVVASIVIGVVLFMAFVIVEIYLAKTPMIPISWFCNRLAAVGLITTFCCGFLTLGVGYYLIYFYLGVFQEPLLQSAINTLPAIVLIPLWALIAGGYSTKKGDIRAPMRIGWALEITAMGAFSALKPTSSFATSIGVQILHSAGLGLVYPICLLACQMSQPDSRQGPTTAAFMFTRSLGQVFGIAVGGTVFQNVFVDSVDKHHADGSLPIQYVLRNDAELAFDAIRMMPQTVNNIYKWIYSDSLQGIWYTALAFAVIAFLASLFLPKVEMRSTVGSKQRFVQGKKGSGGQTWESKA